MRSKDTIKVIGEAITHPGSRAYSIEKPSELRLNQKACAKIVRYQDSRSTNMEMFNRPDIFEVCPAGTNL